MASRSAAGTWGTGMVSIERMRTCSWRMWLCSTFARIASGAVVLPRLRKTAVPGTRCNGGDIAWSCSTNARRELSASGDELAAALPRRHHGERHDADQQGEPASVSELGQVCGEEQPVDGEQ